VSRIDPRSGEVERGEDLPSGVRGGPDLWMTVRRRKAIIAHE
jgi:hypothetical protein